MVNLSMIERRGMLGRREIQRRVIQVVWRRFSAAGFSAKQAVRGRRGGQVSGAARRGRTAERDRPAHAGEPVFDAAALGRDEVYPRACGGTLRSRASSLPERGLSPRMRGNPNGMSQA